MTSFKLTSYLLRNLRAHFLCLSISFSLALSGSTVQACSLKRPNLMAIASSLTSTPPPILSYHHRYHRRYCESHCTNDQVQLARRSLLFLSTSLSLATAVTPSPSSAASPPPDTTVTDRVFMDFSLCPTSFLPNRIPSGNGVSGDIDSDGLCSEYILLGRLVFGLYGRLVPLTVSNFKSMCTGSRGSSYKGTLIHKIFPGQFFLAGRQGRREKGEVQPPLNLARNTEAVDSKAFLLNHSKGGVLSLCLSENDDEDDIKLDPNYHNVEFLITTGPGPCPQLDRKNIVFGSVLEGLDVVTAIASIPTYKPSERIRQFNELASFLGDERAQMARTVWDRPLKTVFISDCGELKVAKPSLSPPTLP